jgi:hypothetical protein
LDIMHLLGIQKEIKLVCVVFDEGSKHVEIYAIIYLLSLA